MVQDGSLQEEDTKRIFCKKQVILGGSGWCTILGRTDERDYSALGILGCV